MKFLNPKHVLLFVALLLPLGLTINVQTVCGQDNDAVENRQDDDDDDDDDIYDTPEMQKKLAKEAKITKEEARAIALERVPGKVTESELDMEKGKVVWEFEIKTAEGKIFEVAVDAKNGEIVLVEEETDDDDGEDGANAANPLKKSSRGIKSAFSGFLRS